MPSQPQYTQRTKARVVSWRRAAWSASLIAAGAVAHLGCATSQAQLARPQVTAMHFSSPLNGAESLAERRAARVLSGSDDVLAACEIEIAALTRPEGSSASVDGLATGNRDRVVVEVVAMCPDRDWRGIGEAVSTYATTTWSMVDATRREASFRALELAVDQASFELVDDIRAHAAATTVSSD